MVAKSKLDEIHKAMLSGHMETIDTLLKQSDVGVSSKTEAEDWNLLHLALISAVNPPKTEVVQYLIALGVDVNAQDGYGCVPLHYATRSGQIEAARELLKAGADANVLNRRGLTPLRVADHGPCQNLEMMELLLAYGADPDLRTDRVISTRDYANKISSPEKEQILELLEKYSPE